MTVTHLPRRPVRAPDVQQLNSEESLRAVPYGGVEEDGEMHIYALKLATESTAYALGFDDSARRWEQVASVDATNIAQTEGELDAALDEWVLAQFGDSFEVLKQF